MKMILTTCLLQLLFLSQLYAQSFEPYNGSLNTVNQQFHQDYNTLVKYTVSHFGDSTHPVIIFTGDSLVFRYKGKRQTSRVVSAEYHQLKAISHLPLGIFTMVSTWQEGALSDSSINRLKAYATLIETIQSDLPNYSLSLSLLTRQQEILKHCKTYIQLVLNEQVYKKESRNAFAKTIQTYILDDVDEAAKLEITAIHTQTQIWLKEIDKAYIKQLLVVIGSSHQARYRELSVQYFDRILHEQSDGSAFTENRLVFAESVFNESGCLSALARHIIDQEIGLEFFGDRYRMQRDLLSDAAKKYIDELLPQSGSKSKGRK
jgi:hypothetical protein